MKNRTFYGLFAGLILAIAGFALSFDTPKEMDAFRANELANALAATDAGYFDAVGNIYEKTFTKDTITNAANDTLYLPSNMRPVVSNFIHTWSVTRTSISGTANIAVKIEESSYRYSGSTPPTAGWVASLNTAGTAAATAATTATEEELKLPDSHGMSYRCIIDGTGTQSTSYVIRCILKKKT